MGTPMGLLPPIELKKPNPRPRPTMRVSLPSEPLLERFRPWQEGVLLTPPASPKKVSHLDFDLPHTPKANRPASLPSPPCAKRREQRERERERDLAGVARLLNFDTPSPSPPRLRNPPELCLDDNLHFKPSFLFSPHEPRAASQPQSPPS